MEIRENISAYSGVYYSVKERLASKQTQYQKAEIVDTDAYGKALLLDECMQVTERWEYRYHEPLVHPSILIHPSPKRALLIGGGDGGTLREILRYKSIEAVDFAELDSDVVAFSKKYFPSIHRNAFDDPRVTFHYGDGRAFVERAGEELRSGNAKGYDIIIMDMTDPMGPASALYTVEFFSAVKKLFRDKDSIFTMHGESPITWPEAFACIGATLSAVFANVSTAVCFVPMYGTLWSFKYASDSAVPKLSDCDVIEKRIAERLEESPIIVNKAMWTPLFAQDPVIAEAESHPSRRIISDSDPVFPGTYDAV